MLFNSFEFLFVFLPLTLVGYYVLRTWVAHHAALVALTLASLLFYAWWDVRYLPLLLGSVVVNHVLGVVITRHGSKPWLALGVVLNLAALGLFKYADFLVGNFNALTGVDAPLPGLSLPLALSFFAGQRRGGDPATIAAAALIVALPVLVMYVVLQRRFTQGITAGAEKG